MRRTHDGMLVQWALDPLLDILIKDRVYLKQASEPGVSGGTQLLSSTLAHALYAPYILNGTHITSINIPICANFAI